MARETETYWFAGTACGRGTGRAITWQGWLLAIVYGLAVTAAALLLAERTPIGFVAIVIVATALLLVICNAKTPGGLSWRLSPGTSGKRLSPRSRRRR